MNEERWMPIKTWEDFYEISSEGNIKTLQHFAYGGHGKRQKILVKEKIRTHCSFVGGYAIIKLVKRSRMSSDLVHRMVAKHFIPNPENKPQVNHKDGNKLNNRVDNLEWNTAQENTKHAFKCGIKNNSIIKRSPLCNEIVLEIFNSKLSLGELSKQYDLPKLTVQSIKSGKRHWKITGKEYYGRRY